MLQRNPITELACESEVQLVQLECMVAKLCVVAPSPVDHGTVVLLYVVAIMDWYSRKVLAWRLSNTQDASFCVEALEEAIDRYGCPEIFNTDQGSQFTSEAWTGVLKQHGIRISMDGKGNWMDNVFIERLWRSMKYECVYLNAFRDFRDAEDQLRRWVGYIKSAGRIPRSVISRRPRSTTPGPFRRQPDESGNPP